MFTGRMPIEHGVVTNNVPLAEGFLNLGEWMEQKADYARFYVGKWHVGDTGLFPRSTDSIPGFYSVPVGTVSGLGDSTDPIVSECSEAILQNYSEQRPFFLVASYHNPHDICYWRSGRAGRWLTPDADEYAIEGSWPSVHANSDPPRFDEPDQMIEFTTAKTKYGDGVIEWRARHTETQWRNYRYDYFRMIEKLDADVGTLLDAIEARSDSENTIIIFTSDHGEMAGEKGFVTKGFPYEGSLAVPLVISWTGGMQQGVMDRRHLVHNVDIASTICDYAGIEQIPESRGFSLRRILETGTSDTWRDNMYAEFLNSGLGRIIRTDRYKYVKVYNTLSDARKGVKGHGSHDERLLLFDMEDDPYETVNLAVDRANSRIIDEHESVLAEWENLLAWNPTVSCSATESIQSYYSKYWV